MKCLYRYVNSLSLTVRPMIEHDSSGSTGITIITLDMVCRCCTLLLFYYRFVKKPEENKGNYLSGIEKRVRDAVREEMVQLMNDGVITSSLQRPNQRTDIHHGEGSSTPNKRSSSGLCMKY